MKSKKILIYILSILILAGIVIIALKGFNIDMMLQKHDSIEYIIGKDFEKKDIDNIVKEVFGDKKVVLRTIEVFNDAVSINTKSITEEEKSLVIQKLDEKYKNGEKTEEIVIISNPQIRLRELIIPYIIPSIIAFAIIFVIQEIRMSKKEKSYLKIIKCIISLLITQLVILSIIAILRIPFSHITLPILLFIAILQLIICFEKENKI